MLQIRSLARLLPLLAVVQLFSVPSNPPTPILLPVTYRYHNTIVEPIRSNVVLATKYASFQYFDLYIAFFPSLDDLQPGPKSCSNRPEQGWKLKVDIWQ